MPRDRKSTRFIWIFIVLGIYDFGIKYAYTLIYFFINSAPKPALSMLDIHSLVEKHHDDAVSNIKDVTFENSEGPRTWITMGLCWSANAQVHGKENFPYKDAAPLSAQLWMKLTPTKVILQIVYSEEEISDELKEYKKELER